ncbi:hypothetical protein QJR26_16925 [Clostridium baratii]
MNNGSIFKKIEKTLVEYNNLAINIEFLNKEIDILKNSQMHEEELISLNSDLNRANRLKRLLDGCINALSGVDKKVIELRYLSKDKLTWKQIGNIVKFSEVHCMTRIRPRAINKIVDFINGSGIDIESFMQG